MDGQQDLVGKERTFFMRIRHCLEDGQHDLVGATWFVECLDLVL